MPVEPSGLLAGFFGFLWSSFLLLSPMLLLGLFLSGLIHVFISREAILRWLKHDSLKSVSSSAALGVPVPLCSCSVVPVVAEMRRKGASRSSCMSFLITAPETGADSILVTNAFFGWIAAVVRPIISFVTAVVAGVFCIGLIRGDDAESKTESHEHDHDHDHGHDHDHDHDHGHSPLLSGSDDCYVSPSEMKNMAGRAARNMYLAASRLKSASWVKPDFYHDPKFNGAQAARGQTTPPPEAEKGEGLSFGKVVRHIFRYGFVEIADDILFALLVGVALGGVLYLAIPGDLMASEYARWLSYPIMVIVGVPLYICASASTPIAAALVAKGFSPGAALIFLMTGPATNTGTIAIIMSQFGVRFASVYVSSVIAVTVVLGILIDVLLLATGLGITVNLAPSESTTIQFLQWASTFALLALVVWRFRAGALKSGYEDLLMNIRPVSSRWQKTWSRLTRDRSFRGVVAPTTPMGLIIWVLAIGAFLATGFATVPPDSVGYGRVAGKVVFRDMQPGLHYVGPRPVVQVDKWPVREVKSIGGVPHEYVSGDLSLMSLTVNVQYRVRDPYTYHYQTNNPAQVIERFVRDHVRSFVAARGLDELLNVHRSTLERNIGELFVSTAEAHNPILRSIELIKVNLLDINPAGEAASAFRDVSSAQEDQERIVVNAQRFMAELVPQAHGNAEYEKRQAEGAAFRRVETSRAEADAIIKVASAVQTAPAVLENMLWREKLESALSGNAKIIVPSQESLDKVALWKKRPEEDTAANGRDGGQ